MALHYSTQKMAQLLVSPFSVLQYVCCEPIANQWFMNEPPFYKLVGQLVNKLGGIVKLHLISPV